MKPLPVPLTRASALVPGGENSARWHTDAAPACFAEVFADGADGGGSGAALALLAQALAQREVARAAGEVDERALLWVQDAASIRRSGRPYRPGLPPELGRRVIHVAAKDAADALFALEEGLRCRDLAGVVGEVAGNPKELSFTASRRLALAAQKHGSLLLLIRHDARADLSAARLRWRIASAPSAPARWDAAAPGAPAWQAELFRARAHAPGQWRLMQDAGRLVAEVGARASTGSARAGFGDSFSATPAQPEPVAGYAHG